MNFVPPKACIAISVVNGLKKLDTMAYDGQVVVRCGNDGNVIVLRSFLHTQARLAYQTWFSTIVVKTCTSFEDVAQLVALTTETKSALFVTRSWLRHLQLLRHHTMTDDAVWDDTMLSLVKFLSYL